MANEPIISNDLTWDDALGGGKYVKWENGVLKTLVITDWGFYKKLNESKEEVIGFRATVIKEDGETFSRGDKVLDSTSIRLKLQLKPILESRSPKEEVTITVVKAGDKKDTQFVVKEVKGGANAPSVSQSLVEITADEYAKRKANFVELLANGSITREGYEMMMNQLSQISIKL